MSPEDIRKRTEEIAYSVISELDKTMQIQEHGTFTPNFVSMFNSIGHTAIVGKIVESALTKVWNEAITTFRKQLEHNLDLAPVCRTVEESLRLPTKEE